MDSLVSIIVPVYKAEKKIERCVSSILRQTYKNIEVILVDDGSPDRSGAICDELARKDRRIHVIHQKNGGCPRARNQGYEHSTGDYIQFVDADDTIEEKMVEVSVKEFRQQGCDLVICGHNRITCFHDEILSSHPEIPYQPGVYSKEEFIQRIRQQAYRRVIGWEYTWDKVYKRSIIDEHQIHYREDLVKYGDDSAFSLDYIDQCKKITVLKDCFYNFYINAYGNVTMSQTSGFRENIFEIQNIALNLLREFLQKNESFYGEIKGGYYHMYVNEAIKAIYLNYRDDCPYPLDMKKENIRKILYDGELQRAIQNYKKRTDGEDFWMPFFIRFKAINLLMIYLKWKVKKIYSIR